tara:strand:+ start:1122 stop:1352 length:231 start_codon:yes stop_codon:yes gene_type:complete
MINLTLNERTFIMTLLEKYIADNNIQSELPAKAVWLNKLINKLDKTPEQDNGLAKGQVITSKGNIRYDEFDDEEYM